MSMVQLLYETHSGVRWIVAALALVVLIRSLYAWLANQPSASYDRGLMSGFLIAFGIQVILGISLLFTLASYPRYQWEHLTTMLIAVGVAHVNLRWRKLPDGPRFRNTSITMLVVVALVYVGVMLLPQGWLG